MKISQVLDFSGLGEATENSLATKKGRFRQTRKRDKKGLRCRKKATSSGGKGTFGGLGEAQNISLATKKGCFWQIKKGCNTYANH